MTGRTVMVAVPHAGSLASGTFGSLSAATREHRASVMFSAGPQLPMNFNQLWCNTLSLPTRPELFAMHHSDIGAAPRWLDTLIAVLEEERADLVSAVIPIKDFRGFTSTAVLHDGAHRRLTAREVMALPETFDAKIAAAALGVQEPDRSVLLVNTGLWVCRFAGERWIEEHFFHTEDGITRDPYGRCVPHWVPEDWVFSKELAARGKKVVATRRVSVQHFGHTAFNFNLDADGYTSGFASSGGWVEADDWHRPGE